MALTTDDRQRIEHVLHAGCHNFDHGEPEAAREFFTADAVVVMPAMNLKFDGLDAFVANLGQRLAKRAGMRHSLSNILIEESAEGAHSTSYLQIWNIDAKPPAMLMFTRYHDDWVKSEGRWRIRYRRIDT